MCMALGFQALRKIFVVAETIKFCVTKMHETQEQCVSKRNVRKGCVWKRVAPEFHSNYVANALYGNALLLNIIRMQTFYMETFLTFKFSCDGFVCMIDWSFVN